MPSRPLGPIPVAFAFALAASLAIASGTARASDDVPTFADRSTRDVVEVDRSFAILLDPLAISAGVYGGDVDFVLGRHFAASVEGDVYTLSSGVATAFGAGLLFYPGTAFHGLYVQPRAVFARPLSEGFTHVDLATDAFGLGATAGWQWTWDYGFTVRLGGGGMYFLGGTGAPGAVALGGPQLVVDGSLGWAF
ncbi:MAG TPA: hypothetical protein VGG39_17730 [Polyangiaceae bacterium]|jgi:hypothetical protein